jgi:hypothetical protein
MGKIDLPYDAQAIARTVGIEGDAIGSIAIMGVGLYGMSRHRATKDIHALHDWVAAESLYVLARGQIHHSLGFDVAERVTSELKGQFKANGVHFIHDAFGNSNRI